MQPAIPPSSSTSKSPPICLHCGQAAGSMFVHGHCQCLACGTVQVACCEGSASYPGADTR